MKTRKQVVGILLISAAIFVSLFLSILQVQAIGGSSGAQCETSVQLQKDGVLANSQDAIGVVTTDQLQGGFTIVDTVRVSGLISEDVVYYMLTATLNRIEADSSITTIQTSPAKRFQVADDSSYSIENTLVLETALEVGTYVVYERAECYLLDGTRMEEGDFEHCDPNAPTQQFQVVPGYSIATTLHTATASASSTSALQGVANEAVSLTDRIDLVAGRADQATHVIASLVDLEDLQTICSKQVTVAQEEWVALDAGYRQSLEVPLSDTPLTLLGGHRYIVEVVLYAGDTILVRHTDHTNQAEMIEISIPKFPVSIQKRNEENTPLAGAQLVITQGDTTVIEWTSTQDDRLVELDPGIYQLVERVAPDGYQCAKTISFQVFADGRIQLLQGDELQPVEAITMIDLRIPTPPVPPIEEYVVPNTGVKA